MIFSASRLTLHMLIYKSALERCGASKMGEVNIFRERRRDLWDPRWIRFATLRDGKKRERKAWAKSSVAGKPEEAEGNKGKREVEKRMAKDRGKGGRENAQRRDAAMRSSLDVTREKNIPRVKFRVDVDVFARARVYVCTYMWMCVCETATTG